MNILVLNAGSNSLKFEVVHVPGDAACNQDAAPSQFGKSLLSGSFDDIGKPAPMLSLLENKQPRHQERVAARDHGEAADWLLRWLGRGGAADHGVEGLSVISRIAHRVVHGADRFDKPECIDEAVVADIEALAELAPLHNASALRVIHSTRNALHTDIPMFAVFDTVFHRSIPDIAALYALPADIAHKHHIRRYGFHGLSHQYLMLRFAEIAQRRADDLKLITLHLEGGSSAAAIDHGRSIDTSMGFTPLEGLMMGTRSGDIDPSIVIHLMRREGWNLDETEAFLNKKCGLLGVSGFSSDTRELRDKKDELPVKLALDMFCYRVRKYIGAYLAALGGADAVVFGGGIGENTASVRAAICNPLAGCGAVIDARLNDAVIDREGSIATPDSALKLWVIPTQEGLMMANLVADL